MNKSMLHTPFRIGTIPLLLLLLLGAAFGLLIPWLGFYWDDWPVIFITRLQGAEGLLDFYQYDRPFSAWTYLLSAPLLGANAWAWHLFSLLLRWLTAVGLWWCLRGLWPSRPQIAGWTALLFAVHPAFTQQSIAVAYSQHWTCYALYFLSLGAMIYAARPAGTRRPAVPQPAPGESPARYQGPLPASFQGAVPRSFEGVIPDSFQGAVPQSYAGAISAGYRGASRTRLDRAFWLTLLGVASMLVNLFTMEYFLGLELLRPVVLWFLSAGLLAGNGVRSRLGWTLRRWLPYLLGLLVFVVWRLFFLELADDDPNRPVVLFELLSNPLSALLGLAQTAAQDSLQVLIASWYNVLQPAVLDLRDRFLLLAIAAGALAAAALAFAMRRNPEDAGPDAARSWLPQAFVLGLLGLLLGPLPAWLTGKQVLVGLYGSRFALPAMFGASLLVVAFLDWLTPRRTAKTLLLSVLIGLAVVFHLRTGNEFRWNWTEQSRFYWQLAWRAPSLQAGTTIFSEGELFKWVGDYSTSMGANLLYPRQEGDPDISYWFLDLENNYTQRRDALLKGIPIKQTFRSFEYNAFSTDSLVIDNAPVGEHCLWVLGPNDLDNPELGALARQMIPLSNFGRISAESEPGFPPAAIFGEEPAHTWCYYFQKAELHRQLGDWQAVASLGDQAVEAGMSPNDEQEWLPFIEGYAHAGRWDRAISLSETVSAKTKYQARLCNLWNRIDSEVPAGAEKDTALQALHAGLPCTQP